MNDLNYNAGMSSYQFVNSLSSCYGGQQPGAAAGRVAGEPALPAPGADYYSPGGGYPGGCYSPGQGYQQYPTAQSLADYTQLQPRSSALSPALLPPAPPPVPPACKYAESSSSAGVASPQDLSTAGPGRSSPLSTKPPPATPLASPADKPCTVSSPASSTSSTSSQEAGAASGKNSKGGSSGGNPPQIYPWMKRVHLGQSKFINYSCLIIR